MSILVIRGTAGCFVGGSDLDDLIGVEEDQENDVETTVRGDGRLFGVMTLEYNVPADLVTRINEHLDKIERILMRQE